MADKFNTSTYIRNNTSFFKLQLKGFSHRNLFFFCFYNVILFKKLCKKVLYSMAKLFFNQKLFHFFCQNVPSSIIRKCILYMVYCISYMEVTVGKKKKGKTWRNEVETKTVKIATSEIHFSILNRNFTIL